MKTPYYTLEDAEERNHLHPTTFEIPPDEDRKNVKKGYCVKLMFKATDDQYDRTERMWVKVTQSLPNGDYMGTLDNDPVLVKASHGDSVMFNAKHICSILRSH